MYDTINKDAQYSLKVRRLGEYHPGLAATKDQEGQDIGDPLYGNGGGVDELVAHDSWDTWLPQPSALHYALKVDLCHSQCSQGCFWILRLLSRDA